MKITVNPWCALITFKDGPAAGVILALKRAPLYLRVVRKPSLAWDALDQVSDTPEPGEELFAYRRVEDKGKVHIYGGKATGWYAVATYAYVKDQPAKPLMMGTNSWQEWCKEQVQKLNLGE